jgi:hypothetical protein|tara:strand:- start:412 stop:645 length:234 start_codon:yes stop_codon:yes gene_type:complete
MIKLVPAYGRDYKTLKSLKADFHKNKDFRVADIGNRWNGSYVNKQGLSDFGLTTAFIRYNKLRAIGIMDLNEKGLEA